VTTSAVTRTAPAAVDTTSPLPGPRSASEVTAVGPARKELPGWPLTVALFGLPVFWMLGVLPFIYVGVALVMVVLMVFRRGTELIPGLLPWFAFLVWTLTSSVMVTGTGQAIGYLMRVADLVAVGVIMVYYVNARERVTPRLVMGGLVSMWLTTVGLGLLAIAFPDTRITTPVGLLMPEGLTSNTLVSELVFPRLAEVQQPGGVEEPYNRPAAPFPYANSWGVAYVLLTPVVIAFIGMAHRRLTKVLLVIALPLSVWPALETSNRGMFLGLAVVLLAMVGRLALRGRFRPALATMLATAAGAYALVASGAAAEILGRQEYSDSTSTRANVYGATIRATLESPLLGWANPQNDATIGIAIGTQGYVWTLMFCFGFVGLGLFLVFLLGGIARTAGVVSTTGLWLHAVLLSSAVIIFFYGLGGTQLLVVCLCLAVLLRARRFHEEVG